MKPRERPVPRVRVLAAAAAALLAIVLLGVGIGALRHADEIGDVVALAPDPGDPRLPTECPEPTPREGLERAEEVAPQLGEPAELGSDDLLSCPQVYDGRRVVYRGEAVGQVLGRGERVWLQVNDDIYASEIGPLPAHRYYEGGNSGLAVSLPRGEVEALTARGGPQTQGDQVEVHGVFHRVDPDSGEMAIIAAERLEVLAPGRPLTQQGRTDRRVVAYLVSLVALGMVLYQRRRSRA